MLWPHTFFQEVLSTGTGQQFVFSTAPTDAHPASRQFPIQGVDAAGSHVACGYEGAVRAGYEPTPVRWREILQESDRLRLPVAYPDMPPTHVFQKVKEFAIRRPSRPVAAMAVRFGLRPITKVIQRGDHIPCDPGSVETRCVFTSTTWMDVSALATGDLVEPGLSSATAPNAIEAPSGDQDGSWSPCSPASPLVICWGRPHRRAQYKPGFASPGALRRRQSAYRREASEARPCVKDAK